MLSLEYKRGVSLDYLAGPNAQRALVAYLHGGGFVHGSRKDRLAAKLGPLFAERDIAFASIDYHLRGRPLKAFPVEQRKPILDAAGRSQAFYPEVRPQLLGPLLYRGVLDLTAALDFLRHDGRGPSLSGLPLALIGMSAGGLIALGSCYGLDGLDLPSPEPIVTFALAAVPPQPWRVLPGAPPSMLLASRDDEVFPRSALQRAGAHIPVADSPMHFGELPAGRHNGPLRALLSDESGMDWANFVVSTICAEV